MPTPSNSRSGPAKSGSVVAFAGHMIDAPGRAKPRFPASSEQVVARAIREQVGLLDARVGVTALANGADILFSEAMLERGAELHAVLPLNIEEFLEQSVRNADDEQWEPRFHAVREQLTDLEVFGDDYLKLSGTPFQLSALLMDGQAQMIARERGMRSVALAVWDGLAGDGLGGTASFVGHCVQQERSVWAIHPMTGATFRPGPEALEAAQKHTWRKITTGDTVLQHRLASFLFADAKGFGGLRESQIPTFTRTVLKVIRGALEECKPAPLVVNTWGDGLFIATERPAQAARIALALLERSAKVNWQAEGLPGRMTFRIGLHAGPAFYTENDPIVGRPNAYGRDVSLAARIEPVVNPAGQAWASRSFVVLAAATGSEGLAFEDLGVKELPKDAGEMSLYNVRRG